MKEDNKIKMKLQLLADDVVDDSDGVDGNEPTDDDTAATDDNNSNEKTFTQEELDKIVQDRIARESKKLNKELQSKMEKEKLESERLAKLTEDERAKVLAEKRVKELEEREKQIQEKEQELERVKLLNMSKDILADKSLSTTFADILTQNAKDAEEITTNINTFEKEFMKAVEIGVNERLKGSSPLSSTKGGVKKFDLSNMTEKEINDNWDEIQKQF
ncbi:DUF4355 domain-containing protein [Metaclostridioides mangenotii]|uniref:DUF4355 domain-containing protein n=1 Tax=Metaclostridioides mangenotii TaxID=1540 RepID=UPI000489614F|nr:DUF4355 domain-containing protein [Clostridioides mangenotii]